MFMRASHIPTVADLAADPITHHYDDMIAPAGLTNHLGTVRVDHDLVSVTAVQFPPVSQGLATTAVAFVDGRIFKYSVSSTASLKSAQNSSIWVLGNQLYRRW